MKNNKYLKELQNIKLNKTQLNRIKSVKKVALESIGDFNDKYRKAYDTFIEVVNETDSMAQKLESSINKLENANDLFLEATDQLEQLEAKLDELGVPYPAEMEETRNGLQPLEKAIRSGRDGISIAHSKLVDIGFEIR